MVALSTGADGALAVVGGLIGLVVLSLIFEMANSRPVLAGLILVAILAACLAIGGVVARYTLVEPRGRRSGLEVVAIPAGHGARRRQGRRVRKRRV